MALPILDGNQSPTTLSTIIISNAHVPAHTVTSLGTQAITDIATAVSGVELGPNTLNALENITVTLGQVTITGGLTDAQLRASAVTVGGTITVGSIVTHGVTIANSSVTIGGSVTATISGTPSVTFTQASVTFGTAVITGSTSIIGTPSVTFTQIATHGVTIGAGTAQIGSVTASISGTPSVTFGTAVITGSTSILNFPATQTVTFVDSSLTNVQLRASAVTIVGSVFVSQPPISTARLGVNLVDSSGTGNYGTDGSPFKISGTKSSDEDTTQLPTLPVQLVDLSEQIIGVASNPLPISGTVTANVSGDVVYTNDPNGLIAVKSAIYTQDSSLELQPTGTSNPLPISGTISGTRTAGEAGNGGGLLAYGYNFGDGEANAIPFTYNGDGNLCVEVGGNVKIGNSVTIASGTVTASILNSVTIGSLPSISGAVTANTFAIQGTAVTTSSFTSITSSTVLANYSATRKVLTIFNEGAGNLHVCAGATCTTIAYQVRLSAGDYYEAPNHQTSITHSAVFATAGTARVTEIT